MIILLIIKNFNNARIQKSVTWIFFHGTLKLLLVEYRCAYAAKNKIKNVHYYAPRIRVSPNVLGLCHPHPDLPIPRPQVPGNWSALEPRRGPEAWLSFAWSSPRNRRALASEAWPRFWSCSRSTGAFVTWPKRVSNY